MKNPIEEEKNKYIENIDHYLDNLINICYEKSNMQDITATGIKIIKQPIFLIFDDLLNKIEHLKDLNEHQSKEITKAVKYTFELNKEIEIKDKMIDEMVKELANKTNLDYEDVCTNNEDCHGEYCEEHIKEYFRKKVENNE